MQNRVFDHVSQRGHEQVSFFNFPEVGLKAIVSIHDTTLGPALGGCRMRPYTDEAQALDDVIRLSEGMTYKSSLAGLDLGGGKCVLICDPNKSEGRREMFLKFAHCLNRLNGFYITAEDMGTSVADVMTMREVTKYAAGFAREQGGSGDPSPWTALGVFRGILAATERRYGSKDLTGKNITVQGCGHVGVYLVEHLVKAGAKITVCDTNNKAVDAVRSKYNVQAVSTDEIYDIAANIYAPCAIGQTVNPATIGRLKCDIIAGAANNQLLDNSMYAEIEKRGIVYCPDFAINSGGVISVGCEYIPGGWSESWTTNKVNAIYDTIALILSEAEKRKKFPEVVAVELAKERVQTAKDKGNIWSAKQK
ncbi:MAG: Glu/Leu/Phe/Val dehydrogenase dimerization domain-containing protein [bacterium]|nr:Glu/Leu/Phe/Val dehydrogenase dimerization domain-containing protein [bacterium]